MACEDAVIATNDDAAQCKRFAVEKGYWTDPYISQIIPKGFSTHAPEINRGYFARVRSIQILMEKFLKVCFLRILEECMLCMIPSVV